MTDHAKALADTLNRCSDLFWQIKGDFTDPRSECSEGMKIIREALAAYDDFQCRSGSRPQASGDLVERLQRVKRNLKIYHQDARNAVQEAIDALSRAPQPDGWKEKFEAHKKAVHDWVSELAETIGAVTDDGETGPLSLETVCENITRRAREDREKWHAPQPDAVTEIEVDAALRAFHEFGSKIETPTTERLREEAIRRGKPHMRAALEAAAKARGKSE